MTDFNFINEVIEKRGNVYPANNPLDWITKLGGKKIEILMIAPDPDNYHFDYYYNSKLNFLYKKVLAGKPKIDKYVWKRISH